jgi:Tfp pilus assembly protein PilF
MKITGNWRRGISIVVAAAVITLSVGWFGWEPIIHKFDLIADEQGHINLLRPVIWQDSLKIVADFPIFGTGLGSFQVIFPSYRSFADNFFFRHAHNDYIEFLVTGGVPFVILMGWFVAAIVVQTYRVYGRRREPYCRFLYIGAVAGLVGIGLHCFVEFNFQIGANALYFFLLASLLVAAAHTRLRATDRPLLLKPLPFKLNRVIKLTAIATVFCASSYAIGVGMADGFLGDTLDTMTKDAITLKEHDMVESTLHPAAIFAPLNHFYPFLRADAAAKAGLTQQAVSHYQSALRLSPTSALTLQELGRLLDHAGRPVPAEQLLKVAIRRAVQSPDGYSAYADWLIEKRRDKQGLDQMREAIERDPKHARDYIDNMDLWGLSAADMAQAIPDSTEPCLAMAMYLQEIKDDEGAEKYYRKAMWTESRSDRARAGLFQRIYRHYFKQEDWKEALAVMQLAVDRLPDDPGLRISIARVYEKLGITYRASEEYQKALILRPGNRAAQDGLRRLAKQ